MNIEELYKIIKDRQSKMSKNSYTASLFKAGSDRIVQKVGEETVEVIIAAKNQNKNETVAEIADLLFHLLVLCACMNIKPGEVFEELTKRNRARS